MAVTIEPLKGINVGSWGQTYILTIVDDDGVAQDVSGYTTLAIVAMPPSKKGVVTDTGSYTTDGSDGQITGAGFADGEIDEPGNWEIQVELSTVSELFKSYKGIMEVGDSVR